MIWGALLVFKWTFLYLVAKGQDISILMVQICIWKFNLCPQKVSKSWHNFTAVHKYVHLKAHWASHKMHQNLAVILGQLYYGNISFYSIGHLISKDELGLDFLEIVIQPLEVGLQSRRVLRNWLDVETEPGDKWL